MATDIIALTGHRLTPSEIVSLPQQIDTWTELKELWLADMENKLKFRSSKEDIQASSQQPSHWDIEVNEDVLLEFWESNEGLRPGSMMYLDCYLETFFGWLRIYRNTVQIVLLPEQKYTNFFYFTHAQFILRFNRALAKRFGQEKIIYTADNGFGFQILEEKAIEGEKFEEILAFGENEFGIETNDLPERIQNVFFVDDHSFEIKPYDDLPWP